MGKAQGKASKDQCEIFCFDEDKVKRVQESFETVDFQQISLLFKALSDPNRLKVVYALVQEEEVCVCDIANILNSTMATASHHLRLLRNMGLAKQRKEGKLVFYSIDHDQLRDLVRFALFPSKEMDSGGNSNAITNR